MCGSSLISTPLETRDPLTALPANTEMGNGQFRILNEIARGGFGITYLAYHIPARTYVAVKECFPDGIVTRDGLKVQAKPGHELEFQNVLEHFSREAEILDQLTHPSATEIITRLNENNTAYIVMEYVRGETLEQRINRGKYLSSNETIEILTPILELLAEVHDLGMLHRDIKPANIILTTERPELIDFGSVIEFTPGSRSKITSRLLTPAYAPLEQYGQTVSLLPATDMYALGATFYEAITGVTPPDAISRLNGAQLKPIENLEPKIKTNLANAINRSLEMRMENRFLSARQMLETLKEEIQYTNSAGVSRLNTQSNAGYANFPNSQKLTVPTAPVVPLPSDPPLELTVKPYVQLELQKMWLSFTSFVVFILLLIVAPRLFIYPIIFFFLYFVFEEVYLEFKSSSFQSTSGVVIRNAVDSGWHYFEYVYIVKNQKYRSNRNTFLEPISNEICNSFPQNTAITIFYDPQNPSQSVLRRGMDWKSFSSLSEKFFMCCLFVGFLVLLRYFMNPLFPNP